MTNLVASGLNTNAATAANLALRSGAGLADADKSQPTWKRDAAGPGLPAIDGKSALKAGTGPRPGGLDQTPIAEKDSDALKKRGAGKPEGARLGMADVRGAAGLAFKEGILENKRGLFYHPVRALVFAGFGFIENLIRGRK